MDAKQLLEQLLESGKKLAEQGAEQGSDLAARGKEMASQGLEYAKEKLDFPDAGPDRDKLMKNLGIGAAVGGLLALMVGTKTGRRVLGPVVKIGSLAALGGIGYKVYSDWQKSQGEAIDDQPVSELSDADANERSLAIVRAMIAAAKADGAIDAEEQALITQQIESSDLEGSSAEILVAEIQKPLDVDAVAASAKSTASAVEMYLASLLVSNKENQAEQDFLAKLAGALKLDPELIRNLESESLASA